MERAIDKLDGSEFKGGIVNVKEDSGYEGSKPMPSRYRDDYRRRDNYNDRRGGRDFGRREFRGGFDRRDRTDRRDRDYDRRDNYDRRDRDYDRRDNRHGRDRYDDRRERREDPSYDNNNDRSDRERSRSPVSRPAQDRHSASPPPPPPPPPAEVGYTEENGEGAW